MKKNQLKLTKLLATVSGHIMELDGFISHCHDKADAAPSQSESRYYDGRRDQARVDRDVLRVLESALYEEQRK